MKPRRTYRVETYWHSDNEWHTVPNWYGFPRGKADGAFMVLKALSGLSDDYRLVEEQSGQTIDQCGYWAVNPT